MISQISGKILHMHKQLKPGGLSTCCECQVQGYQRPRVGMTKPIAGQWYFGWEPQHSRHLWMYLHVLAVLQDLPSLYLMHLFCDAQLGWVRCGWSLYLMRTSLVMPGWVGCGWGSDECVRHPGEPWTGLVVRAWKDAWSSWRQVCTAGE